MALVHSQSVFTVTPNDSSLHRLTLVGSNAITG
jgi:hypothetical protein